jgi:putative Mg2+ transporter-C (MgtC) family protein
MHPLSASIGLRDIVLRLGAAMLIGAVLGINRELRAKPAGLKTMTLVSLSSALLTMVSISFATMTGVVEGTAVARVVQGVLTGIGFLGAGVILRGETVRDIAGLTTAALIWLAAALGIVCGAGQWELTLSALVAILIVLLAGGPLERAIHRRWHGGVDAADDR